MKVQVLRALAALAVLPLVTACETSKSANPLSPSVAGPIPGVEITAPKPLSPQANASVTSDQQPVTLTVENASSTGQRPLSYRVEVAADAGFSTMVFSKDGITPGGNGRTSVQLADKLAADRTYFWRVRAQDGANTGPFSDTLKFSVVTPVTIGAPALVSPAPGETIDANPPTLIFANADVTGPAAGIKYLLQVATDQAFTHIVFSAAGTPQSNQTRVTPEAALLAATTFYWRVRASAGDVTGPWSATGSFKTSAAPSEPSPTPPPPPPGGGGGGGGGGSTGNCRSGSAGHVAGGITEDHAKQIVEGTADEYPCLIRVFSTEEQAVEAAEQLLLRTIWHLQRAGFQAARQRNPSGRISGDKLSIMINGHWQAYDIYSLGVAGRATRVQFIAIDGANPVSDPGIPD
jgi:hypothetical protein